MTKDVLTIMFWLNNDCLFTIYRIVLPIKLV